MTPPLPPRDVYQKLLANIGRVIHGQSDALRKVLARSIDATFKRVQFTPDLLPSDILGVSIYNQREQVFQFHEGPVFTYILLADEINRAVRQERDGEV